jgi:uncharacterized protein YcnI
MTRHRPPAAAAGGLVLAAVALVALAGPVAAHATADAVAAPEGRTALTLGFEHGCDEAPTIAFRVRLPDGVADVRPQDPPGWTSSVEPDQVVWTGGSITGAGSFNLEAVLAEPAGTTVTVPVIQECPGGAEEAWIQVPDGSGTPLDHPAPTFVVPANDTTPTPAPTTTEPTTTTAATDDTASMAIEATPVTLEGSDTSTAGLVVFIVIVVVVVGGALVLYLRHRHTGRV